MESDGYTKKNKTLLGIVGVLVVLLISLGAYFYLTKQGPFEDKDVLAVVGDKKITQKDLNEMLYSEHFEGSVDNPPSATTERKKEILDNLVEWSIAELEAPKLSISVSDEEIEKEAKNLLGNSYRSYSDAQKEITKETVSNNLKVARIKDKVLGWRKGKFIITRFDRVYEEDLDLKSPSVQDVLKNDKEHAQALISQIYQDIKAGKITFEQGMEKADQDSQTGKPSWGEGSENYIFSGEITKEESTEKNLFITSKNFWDEVFKAPNNEITSPKVFYLKTIGVGEHEAFFAIIKIEEANRTDYSSYDEWLNKKKQEYKVKYFEQNLN